MDASAGRSDGDLTHFANVRRSADELQRHVDQQLQLEAEVSA
jgi:hypothetical protein